MRTNAIDDPGRLSVCMCFTRFRRANTAERTEVLLEMETLGDRRNTVLDGSPYFPMDWIRSVKLLWPLVYLVCIKRNLSVHLSVLRSLCTATFFSTFQPNLACGILTSEGIKGVKRWGCSQIWQMFVSASQPNLACGIFTLEGWS